ncbi:unnamed protein product, partial [Polarella glacialis]
ACRHERGSRRQEDKLRLLWRCTELTCLCCGRASKRGGGQVARSWHSCDEHGGSSEARPVCHRGWRGFNLRTGRRGWGAHRRCRHLDPYPQGRGHLPGSH